MPDAATNPYIGEYEAYADQAKKAYQTSLATITQQRAGYLKGYGLDSSGHAVADNPFGAYQEMMGGLAQQAEESDAMGRTRGFSGGISRQAAEAARRMTQKTTVDFGQQWQQGMNDFSNAEIDAGTSYNNSLQDKMTEITQRAAQDRLYNPADYSDVKTDPYGNPTSPEVGSPGLPFAPPPKTGGKTLAQWRAIVRQNHPNWTAAQVLAQAKKRMGG